MKVSPSLISNIERGNAILFLGAGASRGATKPDNTQPPTGDGLRDMLSNKFLGGTRKDWLLSRVAEYAKGQAGLFEFQDYVKSIFDELTPAPWHLLIPRFRWHAIVTTNYDLIIEESYKGVSDRLQELAPIVRDGDRFGFVTRNPNTVPLLKLHGCISIVNDHSLPLIMASEEYAKFSKNRTRLFNHFKDWALEHPIIFVGYEVEDPNIQRILFDLDDKSIGRPPYAIVKPTIDKFDEYHWHSRRFETIKADFQTFLIKINQSVPLENRKLSSQISSDSLSVTKWFRSNSIPSGALANYLDSELIHVHPNLAGEGVSSNDFYRGFSQSWDVFREELDLIRRINDDSIANWVFSDEADRVPHCYLIKGHAGSGKSVALRRIAWDASNIYDQLVFLLKEGKFLRIDLLEELYSLLKQRIVIFIDDIVRTADDVLQLLKYAHQNSIPITLICGARTNEWNVTGDPLTPFVHGEHELRDLSEVEIRTLLSKLKKHDCLGHLVELSEDEAFQVFKLTAERQLLVALHEATSGKPFEEIIFDEYRRIYPDEAKILYLDVCTLHRLNAPVRAGLINRVSGVSFEHFKEKLLNPLQHVIKVNDDLNSRSFVYKSRHPIVADFVFQKALPSAEARVNQIVRILGHMNIDYESDRSAFSHLISGQRLAEMFGDRSLVDTIYDVAAKAAADSSYINHQRAVFELRHDAGSAKRALKFLAQAEEDATGSLSAIRHSRAMALEKLARQVDTDLEKSRFRQEAKDILRDLLKKTGDAYSTVGFARILLDEIREKIDKEKDTQETDSAEKLSDRVRTGLIEETEAIISGGLQRFPDDEHLLLLQAKLASLLEEWPQAIRALKAAFSANPRNERVAVRLSRHFLKEGNLDEAKRILQHSQEHNPHSKSIHFQFAQLHIEFGEEQNRVMISHHLKRSFTEGDSNRKAQMMFARHEFLYGNRESGKSMFSYLRTQRIAPYHLNQVWGHVKTPDGELVEFAGYVNRTTSTYCFANVQSLDSDVFVHSHNCVESHWDQIASGKTLKLNLAFTIRGPFGLNAWVT